MSATQRPFCLDLNVLLSATAINHLNQAAPNYVPHPVICNTWFVASIIKRGFPLKSLWPGRGLAYVSLNWASREQVRIVARFAANHSQKVLFAIDHEASISVLWMFLRVYVWCVSSLAPVINLWNCGFHSNKTITKGGLKCSGSWPGKSCNYTYYTYNVVLYQLSQFHHQDHKINNERSLVLIKLWRYILQTLFALL